jgi:hypothetical protein
VDDFRYSRSVLTWLIVQIVSSAVNSVWVESSISARNAIASIFISAAVSVVQVLLTSSLLWKIKPKHRFTGIAAGAGFAFFIPIGLYLLIGPLSWIADVFTFILWMLLRCSFSILIVGTVGGAWLGYMRTKLPSTMHRL